MVVPSATLRAVGLDPAQVTDVVLFHEKHGNRLYRLRCGGRSWVLKWFAAGEGAVEVRGYGLLERLGLPTLPVHGRAPDALLLEDLTTSPRWRLATPDDVARPETARAVARWYGALHRAGRALLAGPAPPPGFLRREVNLLDAATLRETGARLGLASAPGWALATERIEALKAAVRALPQTLNYNDFHWSNLALSRRPPLRAVVFDYHLLGIGPRYSDYRNVASGLVEPARSAFWDACPPVDQRERLLDEPTSILYALTVAAQRPRLPGWAEGPLEQVRSGALEQGLRRALEIL